MPPEPGPALESPSRESSPRCTQTRGRSLPHLFVDTIVFTVSTTDAIAPSFEHGARRRQGAGPAPGDLPVTPPALRVGGPHLPMASHVPSVSRSWAVVSDFRRPPSGCGQITHRSAEWPSLQGRYYPPRGHVATPLDAPESGGLRVDSCKTTDAPYVAARSTRRRHVIV